jgi:hypothetical protein
MIIVEADRDVLVRNPILCRAFLIENAHESTTESGGTRVPPLSGASYIARTLKALITKKWFPNQGSCTQPCSNDVKQTIVPCTVNTGMFAGHWAFSQGSSTAIHTDVLDSDQSHRLSVWSRAATITLKAQDMHTISRKLAAPGLNGPNAGEHHIELSLLVAPAEHVQVQESMRGQPDCAATYDPCQVRWRETCSHLGRGRL